MIERGVSLGPTFDLVQTHPHLPTLPSLDTTTRALSSRLNPRTNKSSTKTQLQPRYERRGVYLVTQVGPLILSPQVREIV
ncbi:hypothetical protein OPV22_009840 [Ensete ventricosum]|uniref:Uncharacterized protein n=1 Tax=Ensete ventricosum TaxID=4639 RepID=A0AAV8RJT5_ENSVE|nr:hypothetical protein OPV22_009840 [Ensete ventricosum]